VALFVWAASISAFAVISTVVWPLRAFGPGRNYMKSAIFPTAYILAAAIGTIPETLSRLIARLTAEGRIRWKGKVLTVKVEVEGKERVLECDKVLVAVGFRPNTEGLGLDKVGVRLSPKGFVEVDERYQTSAPGIHAIGDLTGPPFLAHKASKEGEIAAEVIAGRKSARDWVAMPGAIFTEPEVGTVGMGEEEARKAGYEPLVGKFYFSALGRAVAIDHTDGFVKVVGDKASKQLLGVTIAGPEASDLIAEAALALEMGANLEDVALTVHAHPTLPEAFMEACKAALGEAIHRLNRPERPPRSPAPA
jgi:dihydrolipoamide dehydrogenase